MAIKDITKMLHAEDERQIQLRKRRGLRRLTLIAKNMQYLLVDRPNYKIVPLKCGPFKCLQCGSDFDSFAGLRQHNKSH